ncbi:MAG: hypothetical protein JSV21_00245 [Nitrospirota bacterium]|nr:MAG: hypothetical protein JSV21_00245 [Nitrospirota bacterium]
MNYRRNYTEKKALKEEQKIAAGLISEQFPKVHSITIDLTYSSRILTSSNLKRTIYFYPDTYAYFQMGCMTKSCSDGGYDLSPVIQKLIMANQERGRGEMDCANEKREHESMSYEIKIRY